MAGVRWCAQFSIFLTLFHAKRVWKDKAVIFYIYLFIYFQKRFPRKTGIWKNQKKTPWLGTASILQGVVNLTLLWVRLDMCAQYFAHRHYLSFWVSLQNIILINKSHKQASSIRTDFLSGCLESASWSLLSSWKNTIKFLSRLAQRSSH